MICQHMRQGEYEGEATVYAHEELIELLKDLAVKLLQKKDVAFIGKRLHLIPVADDESVSILSTKSYVLRYPVNESETIRFLHGTW